MKILVVDDEALARKRIIKLLKDFKEFDLLEEASSGKEALEMINITKPNLVFLDIQMTDMSGFDVLQKLDPVNIPIIIFVTAYDNFALQAFDAQAIDFLLKPYKEERFLNALNRAIALHELKQQDHYKEKISGLIEFINKDAKTFEKIDYLKKIVLKLSKRYYFIEVDDIEYILSSASYVEIVTHSKKKHLYRIAMTELIKKLDPKVFQRINRSTIININDIKEIISEGFGGFSVVMKSGESFSLSKMYKNAFLKTLKIK